MNILNSLYTFTLRESQIIAELEHHSTTEISVTTVSSQSVKAIKHVFQIQHFWKRIFIGKIVSKGQTSVFMLHNTHTKSIILFMVEEVIA